MIDIINMLIYLLSHTNIQDECIQTTENIYVQQAPLFEECPT